MDRNQKVLSLLLQEACAIDSHSTKMSTCKGTCMRYVIFDENAGLCRQHQEAKHRFFHNQAFIE